MKPTEKQTVDDILYAENQYCIYYDSYNQHGDMVDIFDHVTVTADSEDEAVQKFESNCSPYLQYEIRKMWQI